MKKVSFKKKAKKHQLNYFGKDKNQLLILNKKGRAQDHWLNDNYAKNGENFYYDYDIFESVKTNRNGKQDVPEWFYDTLRSQHIPFNLFIPLLLEKELAKATFNSLLSLSISKIENIYIEYPPTYLNPLKDKTSFDTYISYQNTNGNMGFIGIEVKYTEGAYSPTATEKKMINDDSSDYYKFTKLSGNYNEDFIHKLKENPYRQIWRNHLLAFAFAQNNSCTEYISATIYHEGNEHFNKAFKNYNRFLNDNGESTLKGITYREYCACLMKYATTKKQLNWISYIIKRYNVELI